MSLTISSIFCWRVRRALAARYGFLTFRQATGARAWLSGIIEKVGTGQVDGSAGARDSRWVTVAFTWNGLRALGVPDDSLATFPEEFGREWQLAPRSSETPGANHPDHWVGGLTSPELHAIVILFARDVAEREHCVQASTSNTPRSFPALQLFRRWTWRRSHRLVRPTNISAIATD